MSEGTVSFEEAKINQVLLLLNNIPVKGLQQVTSMNTIYGILSHPIAFKSNETKEVNQENKASTE